MIIWPFDCLTSGYTLSYPENFNLKAVLNPDKGFMSFDTVHSLHRKMELIRGLSLPLYTVSKKIGLYQI